MSHTNECCIFAIARRRLFELTSDSLQSREKVTGAPMQLGLLAVGRIDRFLPVRMCGFTAVTGTIITKLTLIQQANLTSLTHLIFNLRKTVLCPSSPALNYLNHSVVRYHGLSQ